METAYSFPVALQKVFTQSGIEIPHHRTVVRTDTDVPLSVVSDRYELYSHDDVVTAVKPFVSALGKSNVSYSVERDGARMIATHTFPGHEIKIPVAHQIYTGKHEDRKVGDRVALQLHVINSYNRSTSLEFRLGSLNLRCLNGATLYENLFQLRYSHLPKSWDGTFPKAETVLTAFDKTEKIYKAWAETEATPKVCDQINAILKHLKLVPQKFYNSRVELFEEAETVWDLYNSATAGVTHGSTRISTSGRIRRMDAVNKVFTHVLSMAPEELI